MQDKMMLAFLAIFACTIVVYMIQSRYVESFDDVSATVAQLTYANNIPLYPVNNQVIPTAVPTDPVYYLGNNLPITNVQRECAIYNTSNVDICNKYDKWYNLPKESLLQKQGDKSLTAEQRAAAGTILAEIAAGNLPNSNVCRVNFGKQGWTEPTATHDGQVNIPLKNITDPKAMAYGDTLNWGYCYKPLVGRAPGDVQSGFTGRNGIIGLKDSYTPFQGDMNSYAGVKFSTLTFDSLLKARNTGSDTYATHLTNDYCNSAKDPPPNITNVFFAFPMDYQGVIHDMYPVQLNAHTLRFDKISDTNNTIVGALFKKKLNTTSFALELVPIVEGGQITIIYYDLCGRIDTTDTIPLAMSMTDIANIPAVVLGTSASASDITYGEYSDLETLIVTLQSTIANIQNDINNYTNPGYAADYRAGVICSEYIVNGSVSISSAAVFDNTVQPGVTAVSKSYVSSLPGFAKTGNQVSTSTTASGMIWIWNGFIKAPNTGTYHFYMNTDESADMTVNNQLAASYYSTHGTDGKGVVGQGVYMNAGSYYSVSIRLYNSTSKGSINIYWDLGGTLSTFQYIPASAYFYNDNLLKLEQSRKDMQTQQGNYNRLRAFLDLVDNTAAASIATVVTRVTGKTFLGSNWNPKYLSGVDPRSASDRVVYVQFNTLSAAYTPIPAVDNKGMYTIVTGPVNILSSTDTAPPPTGLDFRAATVAYTVCFGLNVEKVFSGGWRNIFSMCDTLQTGDAIDRTPCLQVVPGQARLLFHHASTSSYSTGINGSAPFTPGTYAYYCIVVNNTTIQMYMNGNLVSSFTLPGNDKFVWNYKNEFDLSKKLIRYNYQFGAVHGDGYVYLRDFVWFNYPLTSAQVSATTQSFTY